MAIGKRPPVLVLGPVKAGFLGGVASFTRGHVANRVLLDEFRIEVLDSVSRRFPDSGLAGRLINSVWLVAALVVRLLSRRINIVHVHCSAGGSFYQKALLALLARCLGKATVLHLHVGRFSEFYAQSLLKPLVRVALCSASRVAVVSDELKSFVERECGCGATLIPNFADEAFFEINSDPPAAEDIVFLGLLSTNKGISTLLDALGKIRKAGFANRLLLAGITHGQYRRDGV